MIFKVCIFLSIPSMIGTSPTGTADLKQDPEASRGSAAHQDRGMNMPDVGADTSSNSKAQGSSLNNVGRVVWQSGFLLADFLIRNPPFEEWSAVRVVDLGAGNFQLHFPKGRITHC